MDREEARRAYDHQKAGAARRGVEWEFNFQTWLDWWGADIERRGSGPNDLQMLRFADSGPYAAWNVRKGTPKDNAKTRGNMIRKRNGEAARAELEAARDASIPVADQKDEFTEDEVTLRSMFSPRSSRAMVGAYRSDKRR